MSNPSKNLTAASRLKDDPTRDEFYTTPEAAAAMFRYLVPGQLKGKRVYCNCDEPWSEIYGFLKRKYSEFGLAGLLAAGMPKTGRGVKAEYDGKDERISEMDGDGSCYSDESLEILSKCDVVATNPPFSNFRKFTELLNGSGKDFLIICNCISMLNRRQWDMFVASGRKVLFANVGSGDGRCNFMRPDGRLTKVKADTLTTLDVFSPPGH